VEQSANKSSVFAGIVLYCMFHGFVNSLQKRQYVVKLLLLVRGANVKVHITFLHFVSKCIHIDTFCCSLV